MDVKHEVKDGLDHLKLSFVFLWRIITSNDLTDSS